MIGSKYNIPDFYKTRHTIYSSCTNEQIFCTRKKYHTHGIKYLAQQIKYLAQEIKYLAQEIIATLQRKWAAARGHQHCGRPGWVLCFSCGIFYLHTWHILYDSFESFQVTALSGRRVQTLLLFSRRGNNTGDIPKSVDQVPCRSIFWCA